MGFTHTDIALERPVPRLFGEEDRSPDAAFPAAVHVLRGRHAIAARGELLRELCCRTGQAGAMDDLDVWLDSPTSRVKIPTLVLVGTRNPMNPDNIRAADLDGAVLIFEYRFAGRASGVLATEDVSGERTVIAPAAVRAEIAEIAGRTLLEQGATVALISLQGHSQAGPGHSANAAVACRIATRKRSLPRYLPLAPTFEATLATLGAHTRRNLRCYRRRLERDFSVEFVPQVKMDLDEFLAMNRAAINVLPESIAVWRFQALSRVAAPVFCGLRCTGGRWLSLLAGRRHPGALDIDWQMNLAGLPRYSLCTAMRSFLLEHEIARGTGRLVFEGGTPHSIRHSFACVKASDVIVQRRSPKAWLLRQFSQWIFPETNFLRHTWRDKSLQWIDR